MSCLLITRLTASSLKYLTHVTSNHKYLLVLILVPFPVFSFACLAAGLFLLRRSHICQHLQIKDREHTPEAARMADKPNTAVEDNGLSGSRFKSMELDNRTTNPRMEPPRIIRSTTSYQLRLCHQRIFSTLWEMPNTDIFYWIWSPRILRRTSLRIVRQGQRAVLTARAQWTDWSEVLTILDPGT